jgi:hypothetical protein
MFAQPCLIAWGLYQVVHVVVSYTIHKTSIHNEYSSQRILGYTAFLSGGYGGKTMMRMAFEFFLSFH